MMAIAGNNVATGAALMFVFGLGTMPMLIATQKTVGMLQSSIKNFRLRQINGVIMMLSGLAVIFIPMMMHHNHGSHNQGSHSHAMNETSMHHDMSTMNHSASNPASMPASTTMPMNHNMSDDMNHNHNMNHDMHNMQDMDKHHEVAMPASTSP